MACEKNQSWTYFESLYFTYVCLLTIGYGGKSMQNLQPIKISMLIDQTRYHSAIAEERFLLSGLCWLFLH